MFKCLNENGFTLIEMIVAVAVFMLIVSSASALFVSSLKAQRSSLAYQQLLAQTSYLMEYMSRAVRMAWKDDITIGGIFTKNCFPGYDRVNYVFEDQCLKFRNSRNECQQFCLESGILKEIRDGNENALTSNDLEVVSFSVTLDGQEQPPIDYDQPQVILSLEILGKEETSISIKTTVSQRNLDVWK